MPFLKDISSANREMRKAAARRHRKLSHKLAQEGIIQLYTDTAQFQQGAAIACHDSESDITLSQRLLEEDAVTNLELIAIRLAFSRLDKELIRVVPDMFTVIHKKRAPLVVQGSCLRRS